MEESLAAAFTNAEVGFVIAHTNGTLLYVNQAVGNLTGYPPSELINKPYALVIHPEDQGRYQHELKNLMTGSISSLTTQLRCIHKDGHITWVKLHTTLLVADEGQADRLFSIIDDVTNEVIVRDDQQKLLALVDNSLSFMAIADLEGRVTYINEAGRALVGLAKADGLKGITVADFYSPDQYALIRDVAVPTLLRQGYWSGRVKLTHFKTGETIPCQASGIRIDDPNTGKPIGRGFTMRDLRPELAAQETQQKLLTLVDNSIELMSVLELDGRNAYINKAGLALLGFESAEQVQETPISQLHAPEHFALVEQDVLPSVMRTGRWSGEMLVRHLKTGEVFPVFNNTIRIDDPHTSQPIAVGAVMRDRRPELLAQQALLTSEARFRSLIMQAPVAVAVFRGDEFVFETVNEAYLPLIGKTRPEVEGKPLFEVLPETRSTLEPLARELLRTGVPFPASEFAIVLNRHGREETCYFNSIWEPLRLSDGRIDGFVVVAHEVTQQVLARKRAEASEAKLRSIIEEAPVATCLFVGPQLVIELANQPMIRFFGRGPSIVGQPVRDVLTGADGDVSAIALLEQVFRTGNSFTAPAAPANLIIGGVESTYYFDLSLKPLRNEAGQVYAILETAIEVTAEVINRKKLEASETYFRRLTDTVPTIIWETAPDGNCTYLNQQWYAATGQTQAEAEGFGWLRATHPDDKPEVGRLFMEANQRQTSFRALYRMRQTDGSYRWTIDLGSPRFSETGAYEGMIGTVVDVHEQVLAGQAIEESEARFRTLSAQLDQQVQARTQQLEASIHDLQRSNENLQQFAYIASHDLQEPLRKIQSFGDLLKNQYATGLGEGITYLDRMQSAASRMSTLIRDLLAYSRISTQQEATARVPLTQVVRQAVLDLDLLIGETRAVIRIDPLPTVLGDTSQLGQLFLNLLGNALKFRRTGVPPQVQIQAHHVLPSDLPPSVKPARAAPTYHRIDVTDNGIGFDEQYVDRIFQVFQRLHGRSEYTGTGIGLAICEKVAANHGGAITARSQPGQGATFSIYLPA
ncbi:PAS domain-containing sensor histidine kinase [Spirosoma utsteinense]|uniref:histidine kinase n=1 Tax=Spirosoma utsteinense TaxID=2585773 RepID=A0ABR6W7G4_9BACT|nr:PAS domain S-box protein [Spirosoma utsteinense]MBC3787909.1 PAS domain S-box-containing protein [Spirosoma utsteinense]MBC3792169.1 PAS domain S-box-containing protein [Spirosoma utsteinense]